MMIIPMSEVAREGGSTN